MLQISTEYKTPPDERDFRKRAQENEEATTPHDSKYPTDFEP
jgi:hypothetical protein